MLCLVRRIGDGPPNLLEAMSTNSHHPYTELSQPCLTCKGLWPGCCLTALSTMPTSVHKPPHMLLSNAMQYATCTLCV